MRRGIFLSVLMLLIILTGCGSEMTSNELDPLESGVQEGYVIDMSDSRILVVSDITRDEALKLTQETLLGEGIGREAVWYSVENISRYEVGQLLRVKSDMMLESYPGQSEAIQVQVVEE